MLVLIISTVVCAILSLSGGLIFFMNDNVSKKALTYVLPFAAGILLGTAFFDLFPESLEYGVGTLEIIGYSLIGFTVFLVVDRLLHRFSSHGAHSGSVKKDDVESSEESVYKNTSILLIISKVIHICLDGLVIGIAFISGPTVGLLSVLAILAHEIPKETGDFAILLKSGMAKKNVIIVQFVTIFLLIPSAIVAFSFGAGITTHLYVLLALTIGFFVYISACEIIPSVYRTCKNRKEVIFNTVWVLMGIALIQVILGIFHTISH